MAAIRVAGDIIRNINLVRLPVDAPRAPGQLPMTSLRGEIGGAWFLARMIELSCADLDVTISGVGENGSLLPSSQYTCPEAVSIWARYEREIGSGSWVWRVEQFLRANSIGPLAPSGKDIAANLEFNLGTVPTGEPVILVLDDENFGFRDDPRLWRPALSDIGPDDQIVLKTRHPIDTGQLWHELISHHADRLTVIVPVSSIRARHAAISRALSWDRAIEDVHRELTQGSSSDDLGRAHRIVIAFSFDGAAIFMRRTPDRLTLERFIYHPDRLEGDSRARFPGSTFGGVSTLTAAIVRHLARPDDYPLFVAVGRALAAMIANHARGGGPASTQGPEPAGLVPLTEDREAQVRLRRAFHWDPTNDDQEPPEATHRAAFRLGRLGGKPSWPDTGASCSILKEVTRPGNGHSLASAIETVLSGPDKALNAAPKARYGAYLTVDREEIERTSELRRLLEDYRRNNDPSPLSIAVFGPPGSGKSFAIKQLARHIFRDERETLEWNLSQLADREDLLSAFDQIRDATVRGKIPLVFWDEFDTGDLVWLKEFLAPMQDAYYCAGSLSHPFGKVIFIFAGGTAATFREFDRSESSDHLFRARKGPDFVSRLKGYVNIKGPNPARDTTDDNGMSDSAALVRRALLLRSIIARNHPHLIDPATGTAAVSPSVIRGFLLVYRYLHGARSMEAIVAMSMLSGAHHFGPGELPSPDLLTLHVTDDFLHHVESGEAEEEAVSVLAGSPMWQEYGSELPPDRVGAQHHARMLIEQLRQVGYQVTHSQESGAGDAALDPADRQRLLAALHEQWLGARVLRGFDWSPQVDPVLRLHPAIRPFGELSGVHVDWLGSVLDAAISRLPEQGFALKRHRG